MPFLGTLADVMDEPVKSRPTWRRSLTTAFVGTALLFSGGGQRAANARQGAAPSLALADVIDGAVREAMTSDHVPGAVVLVVKDGRIIFERGYGLANVETAAPVDPARTLFRIGSITKVFTALAVMQLVDRRRISLDRDVNTYLRRVRVPSTYPQPVTVSDLLTHTSGLDEISPGRKTTRADAVIPLRDFLRTRLIRRQPPHYSISYGTYGISLAGELVEEVSGRDLDDYLRVNVFRPLGMMSTTLGGVPAAQQPDLAIGYSWIDGRPRREDFEYFHSFPASDINSTAEDMGKFMLFHLEGITANRQPVLSNGARLATHRQHFTNHPRLPGMTYGFFEVRRNGIHGIEHGGTMDGYASLLYLAPDQHLGIYVGTNSESDGVRIAVRNAVLDYFFPRPLPIGPKAALVSGSTDRFAGRYQRDEYCHSCPSGEMGYRPPALKVGSVDGGITLFGARWVQVEPLLFQLTSGQMDTGDTQIAFRQDRKGRITHLLIGAWTYERSSEADAPALEVPANIVAEYLGTYRVGPEQTIVIERDGGKLMGRMTGYAPVELTATSPTRFVGAGSDAVITFFRGADNRVSHLILRYGGRDLRADRTR